MLKVEENTTALHISGRKRRRNGSGMPPPIRLNTPAQIRSWPSLFAKRLVRPCHTPIQEARDLGLTIIGAAGRDGAWGCDDGPWLALGASEVRARPSQSPSLIPGPVYEVEMVAEYAWWCVCLSRSPPLSGRSNSSCCKVKRK